MRGKPASLAFTSSIRLGVSQGGCVSVSSPPTEPAAYVVLWKSRLIVPWFAPPTWPL